MRTHQVGPGLVSQVLGSLLLVKARLGLSSDWFVHYCQSERCEVTTMPARDNRYSVNVKGRDRVEYKDRDRTVVFEAGMLDQEVYIGREKVTAGRLDPGQREEVIVRVYHHLNVVRRMGLEFINPDGSRWQPRAKPSGGSAGPETAPHD
jgi:hypothetical protein